MPTGNDSIHSIFYDNIHMNVRVKMDLLITFNSLHNVRLQILHSHKHINSKEPQQQQRK